MEGKTCHNLEDHELLASVRCRPDGYCSTDFVPEILVPHWDDDGHLRTATDFAGNNAIASFRVTVTDGSIGPSGLNLGPTEVAAIVVALGAAATAVVALMRRKRRGRDPKDDEGGASQRGS